MKIVTKGLVLMEQNVGEADKLVTVLTESNGIIRCFARNAKNIKSKLCIGTQSLCYSRFFIFKGRDKYIIDKAEPINVFYDLRLDIEKLALAQYFCEIMMCVVPEGSDAVPYLRLILNSLYFIAEDKKPRSLIKAVFELRCLSIAGFMPDLVCCDRCKKYESEPMYFSESEGNLLCSSCYKGETGYTPLCMGALTAMRYSIYSEFKKIFSFNVTGEARREYSLASERYLLYVTGRRFNSLDFYYSVKEEPQA